MHIRFDFIEVTHRFICFTTIKIEIVHFIFFHMSTPAIYEIFRLKGTYSQLKKLYSTCCDMLTNKNRPAPSLFQRGVRTMSFILMQ